MDVTIKLQEYQSLDSLEYVLLVDTENLKVQSHFRKDDRSWTSTVVEGLDSSIAFTKLNMELKLSDIYRTLEFRPKPKLIEAAADRS